MAPARDALRAALDATPMRAPMSGGSSGRLVYSNVTARPHAAADGAAGVRARLLEQLTASVRWEDTMTHAIAELAPARWVEPAPGAQLKSMMKRIAMPEWSKVKSV